MTNGFTGVVILSIAKGHNRLSGFKINSVQLGCEERSDLESLTSVVAMVGRWLLVARLLGYEMLLSAWSRIQGAVKCSYEEVQAGLPGKGAVSMN